MKLLPLHIDPIIQMALLEDLGQGDPSSVYLPRLRDACMASVRTRAACVVSGLFLLERLFVHLDPKNSIQLDTLVQDGQQVEAGTVLVTLSGPAYLILQAERVLLNFLQHLSGVATTTHQFVRLLGAESTTRITDTRKTLPCLRLLEKQAVQHGGGFPHRYNLGSAVMLKDNHLHAAGDIASAIRTVRSQISHTMTIEVEVETLEQLEQAVSAGADIVLLDNMSVAQVQEAVSRYRDSVTLEASGNISLDTVQAYAQTGIHYISTSKITMGALPVDIGLDF